MLEEKWKGYFRIFLKKNIVLTLVVFLIGLVLHLADTTVILLTLGVAITSTWWQWYPVSPTSEYKLILEALNKYPAVLIKYHTNIVAFNANSPYLAASYQSPILASILRHYIKSLNLAEGITVSVSNVGLDSFLLLKAPIIAHISPYLAFRDFKAIIGLLELRIQATFRPTERFQTIRLFGLDGYLQTSGTSLTTSKNQNLFKVSIQPT